MTTVNQVGFRSYVAIGDSFTEGMGDAHPGGGGERGWADLVALGLARAAAPEPFLYANLAIRGRKLGPLIEEQLEPAIAMRPELVSINGGGNDILRPRVDVDDVARQLAAAARRIVAAGVHALVLSGADPSDHLPSGRVFRARAAELTRRVLDRLVDLDPGTFTLVDNFRDARLRPIEYWSDDRLHLNARGHHLVAANVLAALGVPVPPEHAIIAATPITGPRSTGWPYYREYVLPWVGRRLTGRSSGDGRAPKRPTLEPVVLD